MDDLARVEELIGRPPGCEFDVVVRDRTGDPVVVRNAPFLYDGTPMPTRYYLVGAELVKAVSRLEAAGGVRRAEAEIEPPAIAAAHAAYQRDRDAAIPADHSGPRPSAGVAGTRQGVKCLHAHLAYALAGGNDPVGRWTMHELPPGLFDGFVPPVVTIATSATDVLPGHLTFDIGDDSVEVSMQGGGSWHLPIGPRTILDDAEWQRADPPTPTMLTNALGMVQDHLDDIVIAAPSVLAAPDVTVAGPHADAIARVEIGADDVATDYRLRRADADEVFRTLVAEPLAERRHNPGLPPDHVATVVPALCIVLAVMRRWELGDVAVSTASTGDHR